MPLERSCEGVLGKAIFCLPTEYYGWSESGLAESSGANVPVPSPFRILVTELIEYRDHLRGIIGQIKESDSSIENNWAACIVRDSYLHEDKDGLMFFNFSNNIGKFNIIIGSSRPTVSINFQIPMMRWFDIPNELALRGYGYLTEEHSTLSEIHERLRAF